MVYILYSFFNTSILCGPVDNGNDVYHILFETIYHSVVSNT